MVQKALKTVIALVLAFCLFGMLQIVAIPFSLQDNTQFIVTIIRAITAIITLVVLIQVLKKIYSQP